MKVRVDDDICAAFGVCVMVAPEVFELSDDGFSVVLVDEVPPELEDKVRQAAAQCPSRAISVED
jgi:ferredoxin